MSEQGAASEDAGAFVPGVDVPSVALMDEFENLPQPPLHMIWYRKWVLFSIALQAPTGIITTSRQPSLVWLFQVRGTLIHDDGHYELVQMVAMPDPPEGNLGTAISVLLDTVKAQVDAYYESATEAHKQEEGAWSQRVRERLRYEAEAQEPPFGSVEARA